MRWVLPGVGEGEVMGIVRGRLVMPPEISTHARIYVHRNYSYYDIIIL